MNELLKGIGERLRIQRKNLKLTQAQTAELLEMSTIFTEKLSEANADYL